MTKLMTAAKTFVAGEEGATMVEYGVMIALITAIVVGTVLVIGQRVSNAFTKTDSALQAGGVN